MAYGYVVEAFMGWYSGNRYDAFLLWNRLHGPYSFFYYMLLVCNIVIPQVLWIPKLRRSPVWLFLISGLLLVGMWLERFLIIVPSLARKGSPYSWGSYTPEWPEVVIMVSSFAAMALLYTVTAGTRISASHWRQPPHGDAVIAATMKSPGP